MAQKRFGDDDGFSPWDSPAKRLWKKTKPTRLTSGLVGLSSAAILSVYAAGYLNTQASEDNMVAGAAQVSNAVAAATATPNAGTSSTLGRVQGGSTQSAPAQPATRTPTPATGSGSSSVTTASYKDGTYVGVGNSRHGSIQATVVVSAGKIVSADITSCGTRYPCSKVAGLPSRVVASQAVPTTYVSGATDSSQAYTSAVRNALTQARAV